MTGCTLGVPEASAVLAWGWGW